MKINHAYCSTRILTEGFQLYSGLLPTPQDPQVALGLSEHLYVTCVPSLPGTVLSVLRVPSLPIPNLLLRI